MERRNGFMFLEIVIVIGIIAMLAGGGLYLSRIGGGQSSVQIRKDLLQGAPELMQELNNQEQQSVVQTGIYALQKAKELTQKLNTQAQQRIEFDALGWKTYRNEKYGFEVQYPPILSFGAGGETDGSAFYEFHIPGAQGPGGYLYDIVIARAEKTEFVPQGKHIQSIQGVFEYVKNIPQNPESGAARRVEEFISAPGVRGIKIIETAHNGGTLTEFLFYKSPHIYIFRNWGSATQKDFDDTTRTFQFIGDNAP